MTTSTQLDDWGKKHVRHWGGVFSSDTLPTHPPPDFRCVVNYDPAHLPGSHWLGIVLQDGKGLFFDSYGVVADGDGAFLHSNFHTHFESYMSKHSFEWRFNRWDLQSMHTKTCGEYSLWFCHAGGGPETKPTYWQWATTNLDKNDEIIKELVVI